MAQNIYDNPEFFAGYSQLPRQVRGLDGAPEWPTVAAMMPDVVGKRVVDLGCGFGWASRWMRERGASSVVGLDLSRRMIERARLATEDVAITYDIADLETVELAKGAFDLAYSSLAFHYIDDFDKLLSNIEQSLSSGGQLVFTIEHPIYMAATQPQWIVDSAGRKTWPVNGYSQEGVRRTDWFASGVVKYHRTIATTINFLIDNGFMLRKIVEFYPSASQIQEMPSLAEELERPMMLLVSAYKVV